MKFEVNGNTYEFFNSWYGNRSGFVHETRMTKNGVEISSVKQQYYNRTWESYQFQTVMMTAVHKLQKTIESNTVREYKENNSIKRLTKAKRVEIEDLLEKNVAYTELAQIYKQL